ncbi:MAG: hypothetical protein MNPFHGCM_00250 [Gemmatimonadaceae bacterium]|nr:hypothetical protein [Gemmatimonadaceae bacterium]
MIEDAGRDEDLRARFERLRQEDASQAPAFGAMLAHVRSSAATLQRRPVVVADTAASRWRPSRLALWGAPALLAASLVFWMVEDRLADREFDLLVSEWSRTDGALQSPTRDLLNVPGAFLLNQVPAVGNGSSRRGL